ncbi:hypothetical protein ASC95_18260 [Pelomonas sp. Root1217]|uniref:hypothetical protein n=1 Tax=Pelomonas sp. Root1217 TaxID=1736430 RepID=UPI00070D805E|nr:hypothetical protein [Pelomonas sp. Root1217]KQV47930.1 hypothetical protein ASC95_18260 [Pelomonas sp. Root1217]
MSRDLPTTTVAVTLALLAALSTPLTATAQGAPPAASPTDVWKAINKTQEEGDAVLKREAEQLYEKEKIRSESEANRKLRAALAQNQATLDQPRLLLNRLLQLPDTLKLATDNRGLAEAVLKAQRDRAAAAWPAWQDQVIARVATGTAKKTTDVERVALQLSARVLNEVALWQADATPHASDTIWIAALKAPAVCQRLDQTEPAAQAAQLIEALPAEQRDAAWQGEAARLARWGQAQRQTPPPVDRTLEDTLLAALPALKPGTPGLAPELAAALHAPGWRLAQQTPATRCELLRWWSQEQVRTKRMVPLQALHAWRTAMAVGSATYLSPEIPRNGPGANDANGYPLFALHAQIAGRVVVEQDIDATGKIVRSFIQRREVTAAGTEGLPALAMERELDDASLTRALATPASAPEPAQLRDGTATRRIGIEWVLP